ncbi:MAG TPA: hypothetical protein VLG38_03525 [Gammaproteobacteria bacterium]|nr:hypothetical protein [Gammaproteobacteria bacterium]
MAAIVPRFESTQKPVPQGLEFVADIVLGNQSDGYGDLANHLTMAFWQHFWAIASGSNIQVRMVLETNMVHVPGNVFWSAEQVEAFQAKYLCGIKNLEQERALYNSRYTELLKAAYTMVASGAIAVPPGVHLKDNLQPADFERKEPPKVFAAETRPTPTEKPDFVFLGPKASLGDLVSRKWIDNERLQAIYIYHQYNFMWSPLPSIASAIIKSNEGCNETGVAKAQIFYPGIPKTDAGDTTQPGEASAMRVDGIVTPLPALPFAGTEDAEFMHKLNSDEYAKHLFIYCRMGNEKDLRDFLRKNFEGIEPGEKILLLVAGDESPAVTETLQTNIKRMSWSGLEVDVQFTGFIANPVFNSILNSPNLDAAYLTGDLSLSSGLLYLPAETGKERLLQYEVLDHTVHTAANLATYPGVQIDEKNQYTFTADFLPPCGVEQQMFSNIYAHINGQKKTADPSKQAEYNAALLEGAKNCDFNQVLYALQNNADENVRDADGKTPLLLCIQSIDKVKVADERIFDFTIGLLLLCCNDLNEHRDVQGNSPFVLLFDRAINKKSISSYIIDCICFNNKLKISQADKDKIQAALIAKRNSDTRKPSPFYVNPINAVLKQLDRIPVNTPSPKESPSS